MSNKLAWLVKLWVLIPLVCINHLFAAEVDLLNISKVPNGTGIAENLVVKVDGNGMRYVTASGTESKLSSPVKLFSQGGFEIVLKMFVLTDSLSQQEETIFLIPSESDKAAIRIDFSSSGVSLKTLSYENGFKSFTELNWNKNATNTFKLSVLGNTMRLHVNDVLAITVDSKEISMSYEQLQFTKINSDTRIYELKAGGYTLAGDCIAEYTPDGHLHIPCVRVTTGQGAVIYDVWMRQHPGVFTFDLDLDSIQQR